MRARETTGEILIRVEDLRTSSIPVVQAITREGIPDDGRNNAYRTFDSYPTLDPRWLYHHLHGESIANAHTGRTRMTRILVGVVCAIAVLLIVLVAWRFRHEHRIERIWRALAEAGSPEAEHQHFHPQMVESLPAPARRYLLHAIEPGTPLATSVRLDISGSIRLSRDADPLPMDSEEILAPPRGYIWRARVRQGPVTIRGFDAYAEGEAEMRWWLAGFLPVVRAKGDDLARSAIGRLLGEAVFLPAILLPARGAIWAPVNDSTARVRLKAKDEVVEITVEVGPDGSLRSVSFPRWNADPANGPEGYLRFATDQFAEEQTFNGYTIPTRFRSGWRLGDVDEFAFFFASITNAEYR